jgi:hypothetical protein
MGLAVNVVPSVMRIHRQLRALDQAYMATENEKQIQVLVEAKFEELHAIHDLLPTNIRDKSWILQMQAYGPWGKLSKS